MPSPITPFNPTQFFFAVRFDQGYRYLDRCGEAVIRLEDTLDRGWIPGETIPTGGQFHNYSLGLWTQFNSSLLTVVQYEFMSHKHFADQGAKILNVLCNTFEIKRIFAPAFRSIYQIGFETVEGAEQFLREMQLCVPDPRLIGEAGGDLASLSFTLCTEKADQWNRDRVTIRKRLDAKVIRQTKQPLFDERIVLRLSAIASRYHDALDDLRNLKRQHSQVVEVALQFEMDFSIEDELNVRTFDSAQFFSVSHRWSEQMREFVQGRFRTHKP